jgi:MerR family transcriptional regulator/heat shock protein HspR
MIGVAAELCGVHPQTLRQYERLGLIKPARVGARNRLYSELDIDRIKRIQRLSKELGVNLAGVEVVLKLLDEMEELRLDFEQQFNEYVREAEVRMQAYMANSKAPVRRDEPLLPVPRIKLRRVTKL